MTMERDTLIWLEYSSQDLLFLFGASLPGDKEGRLRRQFGPTMLTTQAHRRNGHSGMNFVCCQMLTFKHRF